MKMYYHLTNEPQGNLYCELIDFLYMHAQRFCLVIQPLLGTSKRCTTIQNAFNPFLLKEGEVSEWPGTKIHGIKAIRYEYSLSLSSIDLLKIIPGGLYDWKQPELPEDIAFLRSSGDPILITISHEREAILMISGDEYNELIRMNDEFSEYLVIERRL